MSDTQLNKPDKNYRVLARKYRPTNFDELIGQEAMVRTLSNAIESGRLAHAFILTGVRGVGKTTTARIIAKALNCIGPEGTGAATISPCGICDPCIAIAESRHVDVMEMDAASRTGVDDIREIIEGVRYASVSARFKIYIIDEIHMLSRHAFNALLKTLEEPPEHVKFIFATTEIRKVPVTVLSRCQRFDLRRISIDELNQHFSKLATLENYQIEDKAVTMISRAAEGSVRDGLSLLDQAFAHGAGKVSEQQVRDMLGLADRAQILDLYQAVMKGEVADALAQLRHQYDHGADPAIILSDMLDLTHWLTRLKVVPDAGEDSVTSETERKHGLDMARGLAMPVLTRAWQMLLKGLAEVRMAPSPLAAAEMLLVRMTYASGLPTPGDMVRQLTKEPTNNAPQPTSSSTPSSTSGSTPTSGSPCPPGNKAFRVIENHGQARMLAPETVPQETAPPENLKNLENYDPLPKSFAELVALFVHHNEASIAFHLNDNVHAGEFIPGRLALRLKEHSLENLIGRMSGLLKQWTGKSWLISQTREQGDDTLHQQDQQAAQKLQARLTASPLVKAILDQFPGAKISDSRKITREITLLDDGSSDYINDQFLIGTDEFGLD